jgi:uncharacterized protein involved in outer membrane biogenesis
MKKPGKFLLISTGITLLVLLILLLVLPHFISMERFREPIIQQMSTLLNREVTIKELRLSLFPRIGLNLSNLKVYEEDPAHGEFFHVDSFRFHLQFFPLLLGRLKIGDIYLFKPTIQIIRFTDGRLNLPKVGNPKTGKTDQLDLAFLPQGKSIFPDFIPMANAASPLPSVISKLHVSRLTVSQGNLHYLDQSSPSSPQKLEEIEIRISNLSLTKPIHYFLSALFGEITKIPISMEGEAVPDLSNESITLIENKITFDALEFLLSGVVNAFLTEPDLNLNLQSAKFPLEKIKPLWANLGGSLPPEIQAKGPADFSLSLKGPTQQLSLKGNISADPALLEYGTLFKKKEGAPGNISYKVLFTPTVLNIEKMSLNIESSDINVQGKIILKPSLDIRLNLTSKRLEGQSWLLPPASVAGLVKKDKIAEKKNPKPGPPKRALPTVRVTVFVEEGEMRGIRFSKLKGILTLKQGILRFSPLSVQLAQGTYEGQINVNLNEDPSPFQISSHTEKIQVNDLLSTKPSLKDMVIGQLFSDLSLKGKGFSLPLIQKNLTGKGSVQLKDGRLPRFRLQEGIAEILNLSPEEFSSPVGTALRELKSSFEVDEGKIKTDNLNLDFQEMNLKGKGYVSLDKSLSFRIIAQLEPQLANQLSLNRGIGNLFLKGPKGEVLLPLKIAGTVTAPKITADGEALAKMATQNLLKGAVEKIPSESGLGDLFKGLLKNR